ncbi:PorA family protein [Calidifontibacter terrae]
MRKSAIVIGFGAFFITLALLLKFYAYPRLAVIPKDQNTSQTLVDNNAKFLDATSLKFVQGKITTVATVVADQKASKQLGGNKIVISQWQYTDNPGPDGKTAAPPISATTERYALDRSTGKAVSWQGAELDGNPTDYQGAYTIKLPFGLTKGKSYPYFDTTLGKPVDLAYQGTEKVRGMQTYKYTVAVPETVFTKMEIPGFLFGLAKDSPAQNADRTYKNDITIWADPVTGVFMKIQQHQVQTVKIPNHDPLTVMNTVSVMDDATIKKNVDEYSSKAQQLGALKVAPWVLLPLGVILVLIGLIMLLLSGRSSSEARARHQES